MVKCGVLFEVRTEFLYVIWTTLLHAYHAAPVFKFIKITRLQ
jgi:hypothetical protein